MRYKFFNFLFLLSFTFSQSFFYKTIGNESVSQSPQSLGLGNNIGLVATNGYALLGNPSNIINENKSFTFNLSSNLENVNERRSFILKDSFGDFLTDADYVVNSIRINNFSGGLTFNKSVNNYIYSIGLSYSPIIDFSSKYREEVRGKVNCEDGVPCTRDVLAGYHNFNTDGVINGLSIGSATQITTSMGNLKFGISLLKTAESKINYVFSVDTLHNEWSNLSPIQSEVGNVKVGSNSSFNYGFVFESITGLDLGLFYQNPIEFKAEGSYPFGFINSESGFIEYNFMCNELICNEDTSSVALLSMTPKFQIPKKSGISIGYTPNSFQKTSVYFEYVKNEYYAPSLTTFSGLDTTISLNPEYTLKNYNELKFGVEYTTVSNSIIRTGFTYNESPIPGINSQSKITFGYGKDIENINFNFGVSYHQNFYNYPDIFPVENDPRPDYDNVKESIFNISTSIQYSF